jgi:ribosomal protein S18 acetylase RimI-like enzyme
LIRKRIPQQDDKAILGLVQTLLVPFAKITQPGLRVDLKTIKKRLKGCDNFVALGGGRQLCGFISTRSNKDGLFIDMLAVHPHTQGKGIGSELLRHAERSALRSSSRELYLWVDDTNLKAQQFYASKNYVPVRYDAIIRCYMLKKIL